MRINQTTTNDPTTLSDWTCDNLECRCPIEFPFRKLEARLGDGVEGAIMAVAHLCGDCFDRFPEKLTICTDDGKRMTIDEFDDGRDVT